MYWRINITLVALAALATSACSPEAISCPAIPPPPPIVVEVSDANTGAPLAAGATGSIRSGSYVSPLRLPHPNEQLSLFSDGPNGTYDVAVQRAGYRDWVRNDVYVRGDDACGATTQTVTLQARLELNP